MESTNETYKVIKDSTVWGLQLAVNQLILEGWETQGPLIIDNDGDYVQSLIKKPVVEESTQLLNE